MSELRPAAERFIAAAVSPLRDNAEMGLMAERELRHLVESNDRPWTADSAFESAVRMERAASRPIAKWLLYAFTILASVTVAALILKDAARLRIANLALFGMSDPVTLPIPGLIPVDQAPKRVPEIFGRFSDHQKLLLFGDVSAPYWERFKALWQSEPENPAFFACHVNELAERNEPLPPDYFLTVERIAPENGWFLHLAAAEAARNAVQEKAYGRSPSSFKIKDPLRLAKALDLMERAAALPDYDDYFDELLIERLKLLPSGKDFLERKFSDEYVQMVPPRVITFSWRIDSLIIVVSPELATKGDADGFVRMVDAWHILLSRSAALYGSLPRDLEQAAKEVETAARSLGLSQIAERHRQLVEDLQKRRKSRTAKPDVQSGLLASRLAYYSRSVPGAPPLNEADLKPGLFTDHAMLARLIAIAAWPAFLIAVVLTLSTRLRHGQQVRRLSRSLAKTVGAGDQVQLLLIGVLLPLIVLPIVDYLTPFGGTSFGISEAAASKLLRSGATAGLMLSLPQWLAARRLGTRLAVLGWRRHAIPEATACLVGIAVFIEGCRPGFREYGDAIWWLAAAPIFAALMIPMTLLFSGRHSALRRHTRSRVAFPSLVSGLLLATLVIPFHHAIEKHWTVKDTLTKIDPSVPARTRYDHVITELRKAELLKLLNPSSP